MALQHVFELHGLRWLSALNERKGVGPSDLPYSLGTPCTKGCLVLRAHRIVYSRINRGIGFAIAALIAFASCVALSLRT